MLTLAALHKAPYRDARRTEKAKGPTVWTFNSETPSIVDRSCQPNPEKKRVRLLSLLTQRGRERAKIAEAIGRSKNQRASNDRD